ncbi:hypothetical protein FQR65_LT03148 [Abscondita terminalis]|nr:hypothetical protein FQR65_LT03148 [Abscondita terminalis]
MTECSYIYLNNIPESCAWANLQSTFIQFGKITKIYMHPQREFAKVFFQTVESNTSYRNTHYKKRYESNDVDTSVNRNYVDVFGRTVTTLEDDNGELYVSLQELKKCGFELYHCESFQNGSRIYDLQKVKQFELFMKAKAMEFMKSFDSKVDDEKINEVIKNEKQQYFKQESDNNISSLKNIKSGFPKSLQKNGTVPKSYSNGPAFERNKPKIEEGIRVKTPVQTNSQKNNFEVEHTAPVNNSLRRPITIQEKPVVIKPLSRVSPILNKDQEVEIAHIGPNKQIWVQLIANMDVIESILLKIMTETESASTIKPTLNMICAALYQNIWFRAMVLNTSPLKVQYVDYGNENTEPLKEVLQLSDNLKAIPAQAFPIKFESHVDIEQGSRMIIHPIKQEEDGTYSVRSVKPKLIESTAILSPIIKTSSKPSPKLSIEAIGENGIFEFAMRTSENTFTAFGLPDNLSNDVCTLEEIGNDCKPDANFKPNVGDLVAAKTSHGYVRAIIIRQSSENYQCGLTDFGTIETSKEVCSLPDKYVSIPEFSFECKLDAHKIDDIESCQSGTLEIKSPTSIIFKLDSNKEYETTGYCWNPLTKQSSSEAERPSIVKPKLIEPAPISSSTIKKSTKLARKLSIEVSAENGIFEFAMRTSENTFTAFGLPDNLSNDVCTLEEIGNDCKPDSNFKPIVGDLVAAKTSHGFVRAIILSQSNENYQCGLIDFGTIETSKEVCSLPDKYVSIPEFSFECKLDQSGTLEIKSPTSIIFKLDSNKQFETTGYCWNPLTKKSSSDAERPSIGKPKMIESTPISSPIIKKSTKPSRKLSIEAIGESGIFEFAMRTSENTFTAFGLPDNLSNDVCTLEEIGNDCKPNANFKPNVGDLVAAKTSHGFVRAIIISQSDENYQCGLIDFGTIETSKEVCSLPDKYVSIPEFSFECKLDAHKISEIESCQSGTLEIKSPTSIIFKLDSNKQFETTGYCWNPLTKKSSSDAERPSIGKPKMIESTPISSPIIKKSTKPSRKLSIEAIGESGIFEFAMRTSENTFTAFGLPDNLSNDVCTLEEIGNDCKPNANFKPNVGDLVAAKTSQGFVRAIIISQSDENYQCGLIDFGTIETSKEVCSLPDKYVSIPEFSFECKLDAHKINEIETCKSGTLEIKSPTSITFKLDSNKEYGATGYCWNPLTKKSSSDAERPSIVKPKMIESTPISSPIIKKSSKPSRKLSIEAIGENGIFEFAMRTSENTFTAFGLPDNLSNDVCTLEEIGNDCKPDSNFKPIVGDLVAAKTSHGFVRAIILSQSNENYQCGLIDFGTIETSKEVCSLPDKYVSIPEFSFECKLDAHKIKEIESCQSGILEIKSPTSITFKLDSNKEYGTTGYCWNPLANKASSDAEKPSIVKPKTERKTVVEEVSDTALFDFVEETSDSTFVAFVCPQSYTDSASVLEELNDDNSFDKTFTPNIGDLVVAESPEDYGTTIIVQRVRSLPSKYLDIPQFAVECKITPNGMKDMKNHKCVSCTILSPKVLTLTLENKKEYTVKARCWNPLKSTSSSTEKLQVSANTIKEDIKLPLQTVSPSVKKCTEGLQVSVNAIKKEDVKLPLQTPSPPVKKITEKLQAPINKIEEEVVKRKLVIDETCESGIFECVKPLDANRFIAFALPDSSADKLVELEGLSIDCKFDPNFQPKPNDLVALKTPDGIVRGIILSMDNSEYSCALIDYGTIATTKKVYKVPPKYVGIPEFAFVCKIDTGSVDDLKNSECTSLQIKTPKVLNVTLASGKHFVLHGSHWDPSFVSDTKETSIVSRVAPQRKLVIDNVCETGVFEFVQRTSDSTFIGFAFPCTFMAEVDKLNKLSDHSTPDPEFCPKPGDLVAAPDPNGLVRATILGESKGRYKCAFIDYGLITIVNDVYPLPDDYKLIPDFAFEGTTDSETIQILENIPCKFMVIKSPNALTLTLENGKVLNVKGHRWDPSKTNPLTKKQTVTKLKLKQATFKGEPSGKILRDKEQVIVIGVLKNVVLVRTKECNSLLKCINQELLNFKGDSLEETPQVGDLVVCNFNDNNWYRVIVRNVIGDTASVEYVDYGYVAQIPVKDLKAITDKLASVENTAIKIFLKDFEDSRFNENMLRILKDCAEKKEKFVVEKLDGEKNVFDLIGGDIMSLSTRLQELVLPSRSSTPGSTKRDRIMKAISLRKKNIITLNDITVHNIKTGSNEFLCLFTSFLHEGNVSFCKADDETIQLLNDIALTIPEYVENDNVAYQPELYEVCLVNFEDEWHRAAVITVNEDNTFGVFFVDYGNSHVVSKNDIRKLPEKLGKIRGLAILCTLEGVIKENKETVDEPLLSRLKNDIIETNIYNVDVISFHNNEYRITIPSLLAKWKKDGLL